jgi:lipopolysaccharide/colanic/teichoic acid biosynthesis glycosyltransferase
MTPPQYAAGVAPRAEVRYAKGSMLRSVRITKRLIDVVASATGLAVTAPLMPFIAAAIYLDSPGPIVFRQRRAGMLTGFKEQDGLQTPEFVEFSMFKFRTMRPDAEKMTGPVLATENDPRITRVGRFLRKTRLDELPQLFNVLKGDMSLVGPRPERPELLVNLALAIPFFEERMRSVKPGITGLAQVSLGYSGKAPEGSEAATHGDSLLNPFQLDDAEGAEADDMRMKMLYDLAYAAGLERFKSFALTELTVIAKTPLVMILGLGR